MATKRFFRNWLAGYQEYTQNTESPQSFHIFTGLWTLAGVLQRKVWLDLGKITVYPNIYVVLVAPAGVRKSSAMRIGRDMLKELEIPLVASSSTREALIKRAVEVLDKRPYADTKLIVHNSLSLASEEFPVFLGESNFPMLNMLTNWYDCESPWIYDTKTQGTSEVDAVWFNLIGCATQDGLSICLPDSAIGSGFTSRVLFVVEERPAQLVALPFETDHERKLRKALILDLAHINETMVGSMDVDPDAREFYTTWYMDIESRNKGIADHRLFGYSERKPHHVLKLAMLLHAAKSSTLMVETQDIKEAIKLLTVAEGRMASAFASLGQNKHAPVADKILSHMVRFQSITFRELIKVFYKDADEDGLRKILSAMVAQGLIAGTTNDKNQESFRVRRKKKEAEVAEA